MSKQQYEYEKQKQLASKLNDNCIELSISTQMVRRERLYQPITTCSSFRQLKSILKERNQKIQGNYHEGESQLTMKLRRQVYGFEPQYRNFMQRGNIERKGKNDQGREVSTSPSRRGGEKQEELLVEMVKQLGHMGLETEITSEWRDERQNIDMGGEVLRKWYREGRWKKEGKINVVGWLGNFPLSQFNKQLTFHINCLTHTTSALQSMPLLITSSLEYLHQCLRYHPIHIIHPDPNNIWQPVYKYITQGKIGVELLQGYLQQLMIPSADTFYQLMCSMNSILSKPITLQEYNQHVGRVEDWASDSRGVEKSILGMWLCGKLLVDPQTMWSCTADHWEHHLWLCYCVSLRWLQVVFDDGEDSSAVENFYYSHICDFQHIRATILELNPQLTHSQCLQLFIYDSFTQCSFSHELAYLTSYIACPQMHQADKLINQSSQTLSHFHAQLIEILLTLTQTHPTLCISVLPFLSVQNCEKVLMSSRVLIEKVDWEELFWELEVVQGLEQTETRIQFVEKIVKESVLKWGNASLFLSKFTNIPPSIKPKYLELELLQQVLETNLIVLPTQLHTNENQLYFVHLVGLRNLVLPEDRMPQMVTVEMLFFSHILREALYDRSLKSIRSLMMLLFNDEKDKEISFFFPMMTESTRKALPPNPPNCLQHIGSTMHLEYLSTLTPCKLFLYLNFIELLLFTFKQLKTYSQKHIRRSEYHEWVKELFGKVSEGEIQSSGWVRQKLKRKREQIQVVLSSIQS